MSHPLFLVDAFASRRFTGNPAAVCLLEEEVSSDWMQSVASELNLSETAFLVPKGELFGLRWFTPRFEVDLCGHATLASAHVLWTTGRVAESQSLRFETRSGVLGADRAEDWIRMDFPSDPPKPSDPPPGFDKVLGATMSWFGQGKDYSLVEVEDERVLRELRPDLTGLAEVVPIGVCVTARSAVDQFDFVSRFFAPNAGIDEDPVTGSAHCLLAPYWANRLGKTRMQAFQASARGGIVRVHLEGERVAIEGQAITVLEGRLC